MDPWCRFDITFPRMEGLIHRGLLRARTSAREWLLPGNEDSPSPPDGFVVSFAHFHECGLATPTHKFLRGLLHFFKIELQHFNPNGIQHMVTFIAPCKGFLGITPTSISRGTSSPSPSRRRGRKATGRSCICRWGAPTSSSGTIGSASTHPCSSRRPSRGGTRSDSTSRMTLPPLCQSSPGA